MKKLIKKQIVSILSWQVKRLRARHQFKTIIVAGSVGKTSTKLAIANVLSQKFRVQYQNGNYNDIVSVPLIYFGQIMPALWNPFAWLIIFVKNEAIIRKDYLYDYVVLELGTDGQGQIEKFQKYVKADFGLLTAIAPEHMEFFETLDEVAKEEMVITELCETLMVNKDLCDAKYLTNLNKPVTSYSVKLPADYQLTNIKSSDGFYDFDILHAGQTLLSATHETIAETQLYSLCAAATVASLAGLSPDEIINGMKGIHPVSGRMQHLAGINNSQIIDDTYNASPTAMQAALGTLYKISAPQKIAILGNMNELGSYSQQAHLEIGRYCDPKQLNLTVTIGPDANMYLATAAENNGCNVKTFNDPYSAGEFLKDYIKTNAVILAKGSQNGVFAEETVKLLLANPQDASKLVRQSPHWLKIKAKQFKRK